MASPEALRAAHFGVGRAVAAEGDRDASLLVRAGQHLARAGDGGELGRVYTRWFIHQRSRGDRRPAAALAAELLGAGASDGEVSALVRRLPRPVRWGLYSRLRRVAAAAALLVAAAAGIVAVQRQRASPPDEELIAITRDTGGHGFRAMRVPVRADRWDDTRPLDVATAGRPYPTIRAPADWEASAVYSAARDAWAVSRVMPGPDVQDLFLIRADGSEIRLTSSPGDDVDPSWAPDGSLIAFCSARWSTRDWYHIGIVDPATLRVRQLTFGDSSDTGPRWSLDGTRIAFVRQYRGPVAQARPLELCWVSVDGVQQHCTPLQGPYSFTGLSKWLNGGHVAAVVESDGTSSYASVDVEDGAVTIIRRNIISAGTSPDGQWVLGIVGEAEDASGSWVVFPVARPDRGVEVRLAGRPNDFVLRWGRSARQLPFVTSLAVTRPNGPVPLGAAYRLRARGVTTSGDTLALPAVRWWSCDTATADVSDDGELVGQRRGPLWVHVTAGGWRSDSVRIVVSSTTPTVVLREDWNGRLSDRWVPFGTPLPALALGPGGIRAMWNRGDGVFASGVYSTGSYSAADGLGVETSTSSPITSTQWQTLVLQLDADLDSASLASWDHRTGGLPHRPIVGGTAITCSAGVPGGEGAEWAGQISFGAGQSTGRSALPTGYAPGRWYRVRLQVFPDGRCGAALDGRPLWISRRPIATDRPFRTVLSGNSVGTRMLFGPVEVWQGVRSGVDWAGVEANGARATAVGHPRSSATRRLSP
jgi:hypothetical protein